MITFPIPPTSQNSSYLHAFVCSQSGPFRDCNVNKSEHVTGSHTIGSHHENGFAHVSRTVPLYQAAPCANRLKLEHFDFRGAFRIWHRTCTITSGCSSQFRNLQGGITI